MPNAPAPSPDAELARRQADEASLRAGLRASQSLIGNAIENGHHEFLLARAEQWRELAGAKALLGHPASQILQSLHQALREATAAIELGFLVHPRTLLDFWSIALVLDQRPSAVFLATLPDEFWLPAPEVRPLVTEVRLLGTLTLEDDTTAARVLEVLEELAFPPDPAVLVTHDLQRARALRPILGALLRRDARAFQQAVPHLLLDPCFCRRRSAYDLGPNLTAAALCRLARWRGLDLAIAHPELPPEWLAPPPPPAPQRP